MDPLVYFQFINFREFAYTYSFIVDLKDSDISECDPADRPQYAGFLIPVGGLPQFSANRPLFCTGFQFPYLESRQKSVLTANECLGPLIALQIDVVAAVNFTPFPAPIYNPDIRVAGCCPYVVCDLAAVICMRP